MAVGASGNANYGHVNFTGNEVLGGNAEVIFGGQPNYIGFVMAGGSTLVLASQVKVHGASGWLGSSPWLGGSSDSKLVNQGLISADVAGTTMTINAGTFSNGGQLESKGGSIVLSSV